VIGLVCDTPLTVYSKYAPTPVKYSVAEPTMVSYTFAGSNGSALNGGPLVAKIVPYKATDVQRLATTASHQGLPSAS
jgi:hypothetical protein